MENNKLNSKTLNELRAAINQALQPLKAQFNLQDIVAGNASFTSEAFTFKVEGTIVSGKNQDAQRYETNSLALGLPPLHTVLHTSKGDVEVVGLSRTGAKVFGKRNGTLYEYPRQSIETIWRLQAGNPSAYMSSLKSAEKA